MVWFCIILFACQVFYYEDETTKDLEIAKVSQSYNIGINKAIESSVRIDTYLDGFPTGHGSGNLFRIGSKEFVITASHVVQDQQEVLLREKNDTMVPGKVVWVNLHSDVAIIIPLNELKHTEATSYVTNKSKNLDGKNIYFHGYPSSHDGLLIHGFVSKSDYTAIIMQSNAWFGSSGSVVFDSVGRAVGVVHAIATERDPLLGLPVFIETVVVVSRLYSLTRKDILGILKNADSKSRNPN